MSAYKLTNTTMYPNMMYYSGFEPFHALGSALSVLVWIFVVILVIKLIKRRKHGMHWEGFGDYKSAMGILRERFAKGEISKEEYEERKKVLEQK